MLPLFSHQSVVVRQDLLTHRRHSKWCSDCWATYMVIKILSMHIPHSLNTTLAVPSCPPSTSFKFRVCPAHWRASSAFTVTWLVQSVQMINWALWLVDSGVEADRNPPFLGPHPGSGWRLLTEWNYANQSAVGGRGRAERKKAIERVDWSGEREGGSERCSLTSTLPSCCRQEETHGDAARANRLSFAIFSTASCTLIAGNIFNFFRSGCHAFCM